MNDNKDTFTDALLAGDTPAVPEEVGELAIDVYDDGDSITIKAPMAGVRSQDLELSITEDTVTIRGKRQAEHREQNVNHILEECYWGAFERTFNLPVPVEGDNAKAHLKDGLLTIVLPKAQKSKTNVIEVQAG